MTGWMRDQMQTGHMTGHMMWSNPAARRATCERWMATKPAVAGISTRACDDMAMWMAGHATMMGR
jgi:hypothetical protein